MKVLIICPMLPYPLSSGGAQAVCNMVAGLQEHIEVHYLFPIRKGDEKNIRTLREIYWPKVILHPFVQKRNWKFYLSRFCIDFENRYTFGSKAFFHLKSASRFFTAQFIQFIQESIWNITPDIVQTEFYNYIELVYGLPEDVVKVFVQHEIRYVVNEQRMPLKTGIIIRLMYNKLKSEEISSMNQYNGVLTLTEADCNKLKSDGVTTQIYSSPAGIKPLEKRNECHFSNKLIFVGGSCHSPNVEGIEWFLMNVWASIKGKHPEIVLNIVGEWNESLKNHFTYEYEGVFFLGFVSLLKDAYDGAIVIVPIIRGSGMRMKIVDAVNYGSPFVSTSVGAEGQMYKNNEDCYLADTPTDFANKIIALIEDESLRQLFYKNSLITRDKYYSMESLAAQRIELYGKLLSSFDEIQS